MVLDSPAKRGEQSVVFSDVVGAVRDEALDLDVGAIRERNVGAERRPGLPLDPPSILATAFVGAAELRSSNRDDCIRDSRFTISYAGPVRTTACSIGGGGGT